MKVISGIILCFCLIGSCPVHHDNLHNRPVVANRNVHIERGTFKSDATGRHMMPDEDDYSQPRNFYRVCISVCVISF